MCMNGDTPLGLQSQDSLRCSFFKMIFGKSSDVNKEGLSGFWLEKLSVVEN